MEGNLTALSEKKHVQKAYLFANLGFYLFGCRYSYIMLYTYIVLVYYSFLWFAGARSVKLLGDRRSLFRGN